MTNTLLSATELASLYDQHAPMVYGMICSFTSDDEVANAMLVGTFVQINSAIGQNNAQALTKTDILKITCSHVMDELEDKYDRGSIRGRMRKFLSDFRAV